VAHQGCGQLDEPWLTKQSDFGVEMDEREESKNPGQEGADVSVHHWREEPGILVVRVTGEVDMSNAAHVQEVVDHAIVPDIERLIFDLGSLEFIDSSGLAVLLAAAQKVSSVQLRNPSAIVRRVIEVTGLSETLPTEA
jgi:anti-anti-sigma factor